MTGRKQTQSLGYRHRLHSWGDYRRFFSESEVLRCGSFSVFRVENGLTHLRLGFTLKSRSNAVARNRFKRRVREVFRLNSESLAGFDYNIVVRPSNPLNYEFGNRVTEQLAQEFSRDPIRFVRSEAKKR